MRNGQWNWLRSHGGRLERTLAIAVALALAPLSSHATCPNLTTVQNFSGGGRTTCPCFVMDEEAGAVFTAPPGDYPLEILRVGIGWGSQFGGTPSSLENAIRIYAGGLPNPGAPIFELEGPVLTDGAINQYDLEPYPGRILVQSGPFAATLEFLNENAGNQFAPSVVHDANGCQPGKNLIFAIPGGWNDACALGVTGDWVFYVVYQPCVSTTGVGERIAMSQPAFLLPPRPNPARGATELEFLIAESGPVTIDVHDVAGRRVATLADGVFAAGSHRVSWDGTTNDGVRASSGAYFVEMRAGSHHARRVLVMTN
jgi:hypothetical protein